MGSINFMEILRVRKAMVYLAYKAMYSSLGVTMIEFTHRGVHTQAAFVNGIRVK